MACKKLHIRGAKIFYYFGVLEYVVIIENLKQRRRWRVFASSSLILKIKIVHQIGLIKVTQHFS